jgi:hypothetical protein
VSQEGRLTGAEQFDQLGKSLIGFPQTDALHDFSPM